MGDYDNLNGEDLDGIDMGAEDLVDDAEDGDVAPWNALISP